MIVSTLSFDFLLISPALPVHQLEGLLVARVVVNQLVVRPVVARLVHQLAALPTEISGTRADTSRIATAVRSR